MTLQVHLALPELALARWITATGAAIAAAGPGVEGPVLAVGPRLDRELWLLDSAGNVAAGPEWDAQHVDAAEGRPAAAGAEWLQRPVERDAPFVHLAVPTDHSRGAYLGRPSTDVLFSAA